MSNNDWTHDSALNAFKSSNLNAPFNCNCGREVVTAGVFRCPCKTTWNSFVISSNDKLAGKSIKIVRVIPEFRDRVLAMRTPKSKMAGWVRFAVESPGLPSFVRSENNKDGGDVAPVALKDDLGARMAAGGWPANPTTDSAQSKPADTYKAPAASTSTTPPIQPPSQASQAPKPITPLVQPPIQTGIPGQIPGAQPVQQPMVQQPVAQPANLFGPNTQPALNPTAPNSTQSPRTYKMTFAEDEYRLGWALASSDSSLPNRKLHASFIEGYADCLKSTLADNAPGWDTVAPAFEKADSGKNNSMSDYTDTDKRTLAPETKEVRDDFANKVDKDNSAGQSRSNDSMTDLSGWKASALLSELSKRVSE